MRSPSSPWRPDKLFLTARWTVTSRQISELAFLEQKSKHVLFDYRHAGGVGGAEAIVIDEDGQVRQPALPSLARDVFVDALSERTGVGRKLKTFGIAFQDLAKNSTRHWGHLWINLRNCTGLRRLSGVFQRTHDWRLSNTLLE